MSAELACVYAALLIHDDGQEITAEKIRQILEVLGIQLESYWIDLFATYFQTHNIADLIQNVNFGGSSSASAGAAVATTEAAPAAEEKKEEEEAAAPLGLDDMFGDW